MFGIPSLHAEQEEALRQFFSNQDVFVNLPTSFGKSLIFQATPIMADVLLRRSEGTCIVIIISPLKSLMEDQVRHLKKLNISAVSVTDEHNDRIVGDIIDGKYTHVYSMLSNFRTVKCFHTIFCDLRCLAGSNLYR